MEKTNKKNIEDIFALTPMQEGMLFHYLKDGESSQYFEQLCLDISGDIDIKLFEQAWNVVIDINEMLRTAFRWEKIRKPVQVVFNTYTVKLKYYDFSNRDNSERKKFSDEIITKDRWEKFDLSRVPFRVTLCKIDQFKYRMIISNHHILYDGWSNGIILQEFFAVYINLVNKKEPEKTGKSKFKEFVQWLNKQDKKEQEKFWKEYLKSFEEPTELPVKIKRSRGKQSSGWGNLRISIKKDTREKLERFIYHHKITIAAFLYCTWGILLQGYNNTNDVIFGTTVSGRSAKIRGIENVVGLFINTIPLRLKIGDGEKIKDLLYHVNDILTIRKKYESTPLVDIKRYSEVGNYSELFDSIVVVENYPLAGGLMGETSKKNPIPLVVNSYSIIETTTYDLTVGITIGEDIEIYFSYPGELFEEEVIRRLSCHFINILENILEDDERDILGLEILSEIEKKQILDDFNRTVEEYPKYKAIHELFEGQVDRTPDNIALIFEDKEITYRELNKRSDKLTYLLRERGVGPGTIVGIMVERSPEMIKGILGILKAGGAYLPIDPEFPGGRIEYMLKDSNAGVLLTTPKLQVKAKAEVEENFKQPQPLPLQFINIEMELASAFEPLFSNSTCQVNPTNLAYIIYTSGSTGKPKGVMVENESVVNILLTLQRQYPLNESDVYAFKTPYIFDVSVTELFGWFLAGGKLVVLVKGDEKDPQQILDTIERADVTHINFVPSMFNMLVEVLQPRDTRRISGLKYIFLAGETLLAEYVNKFRRLGTSFRLENLYGPTEGTVYSSYYSLEQWDGKGSIPIGKPVANTILLVLDKTNRLQPIGVPGELCIGGVGLARGYLNQPELTSERFIKIEVKVKVEKVIKPVGQDMQSCSHAAMQYHSPSYHPITPLFQSPIYRTGDLARWLQDGNMEFLGRIDYQVKIRGFRIEPGEIENQLLNCKEVKEAVVTVKKDETGNQFLCAFIVSHRRPGFNISQLKHHLKQKLPGYMIPDYFVILEKIPLTSGGKVDRKSLPEKVIKSTVEYSPPRNEREKLLVDIWTNLLEMDKTKIGMNDNFFELGGHSLKATLLMAHIHKKLDIEIPLSQIFKSPTIRGLALYMVKTGKGQYLSIEPVEEKEYFVLSSAQKRLYILHHAHETPVAYNMTSSWVLEGALDKNRLENTFQKLVQRHDSLRTSFWMIEEELVQGVHKKNYKSLIPNYNGGGTSGLLEIPNSKFQIPNIIKDFIRPFDLSQAPLLRVGVVELGKEKNLLMVDMHHIISDGVSTQVLIRDFMAFYSEEKLPGMKFRYKDYAHWQDSEKKSAKLLEQGGYWKKTFEGEIPVLEMPSDYARPAVQQFEGSSLSFEIDGESTRALKSLALEEGATLYMVLFVIFNIFLAKISSQEDIVVGTPVAGRKHADLQKIIGMFVNTLPIRNYPVGEKYFSTFLAEVKENTLLAFENQEYPYEDLIEIVIVKGDRSRNPLFDACFLLQNMEVAKLAIPGLKLTPYEYETLTSKFDLTLESMETEGALLFRFEYSTKLFKPQTIERFSGYFKKIVLEIQGNPHKQISRIEFLFEDERRRILYDFNDTAVPYPKEKTIHQLFENQVEQTPDHTALVRQITSITYRKLNETSNQLARIFRKQGIKPNTAVGIMMERSVEMLVGILAVLKAGGVYLPIDPEYAGKRIVLMMTGSGAPILFTQRKILEGNSLPLNDRQQPLQIIPVDELMVQLQEEPGENLDPLAGSNDLIYIIFTSGSTGTPKGAGVYHRGFMNLMHWFVTDFGLHDLDTNLLLTSFSFDLTQKNLYASLLTGGTMCIPESNYFDPSALLEEIKNNHITWINCTPSMFYMLVEYEEAGEEKKLSSLRYVFLGGEPISVPKLIGWLESEECHAEIVNTYGPTECTDICASYRIREPRRFLEENMPVGKPVYNTQLFVLNKDFQPLPIGIAGELAIGGAGVGIGYVNDEALTCQKFLRILFSHNEPERLLYRTGDRVKWRADGNIEFLGRMDYQVKVRGYRIEMGEIESRLATSERVAEAVVLAQEDTTGSSYLCAYIVPAAGKKFEVEELKKELSQALPGYMIPSFFVHLDEIPLTPNGKVDRLALPLPIVKSGSNFTPPRDKVEETLVIIWSQLVRIDRNNIGIDDNFFELGGHSLKAAQLVGRIHKELDVEIPLVQMFAAPTIRSIALQVHEMKKSFLEPIEPAEKKEFYRLSSAQNRLYILQQMTSTSTGYNIPSAEILEGAVEKEKLENTFKQLIKRHEGLRTCFEMVAGEPIQQIHEEVEFEIEYYDLATGDKGQGTKNRGQITEGNADTNPSSVIRHLSSGFIRPFDLSCAPLLRVGLIEQAEEKYLLIVDMHHIISDAMTLDICTRDFMALYAGEILSELRIYYKDFSQWQNREKNRKKITCQEDFWTKEFKGEIPVLELPLDYNRPAVQSFEGKHLNFQLEEEQTRTLKKLAMEEDATMFMVLIAIFNILLVKISGQEDIVVGTPVAGRRHLDLEQIVGIFINTLALRNYPSGEKRFTGFLKEVRERTLTALENQDYQFEDLVEKVTVNRDLSRNPLFDVMFVLQNAGISKIDIPGLKLRYCEYETGISKFDLTFNCEELEGRLNFTVEFSTKLFLENTIKRFINYYKKIVSQVLDNKDLKIWKIEILSKKERKQLINNFNDTAARYPKDQMIHQLFADQVEKTPDHVALVESPEKIEGTKGLAPLPIPLSITYRELNEKSNQLARLLVEKNVRPDTIVGIMGERSIRMMFGIMGILKAGGAYLPVDPNYPNERVTYILEDSQIGILLTHSALMKTSRFQFKGQLIPMEAGSIPQGASAVGKEVENTNHPDNLAYVMYTSGSTGRPKGVLVTHRNVTRLVIHTNYAALTVETRILQTGAPVFDATTFEIWGALLNGGQLYLVDNQVILDVRQLGQMLETNRINTLWLTSALFNQLARENSNIFSHLDYLLVGGDILNPQTINLVRSKSKILKVINGYGPTENTTFSTTYLIRTNFESSIPIGRPIANSTAFILDRYGIVQPIGIFGELWVGGDGVSRGYLNSPELTGEKFVKDTLIKGKRLYRTGDITRWMPDGNIEFSGRVDYQVKIRGFRIEPGEIEYSLLRHAAISEAVVIVDSDKYENKFLCAYIVSTGELSITQLRHYLSGELPDYMIPSFFVLLDKIPLTANGKVDRQALPVPVLAGNGEYVPPRDKLEQTLAEIWTRLLNIISQKALGIDDNFFDSGGHSLKATSLVSRIHKELDVIIPLAVVFKNPTIRGLAGYIKKREKDAYASIEPVEKSEFYPASYSQKRLWLLNQNTAGASTFNMPGKIILDHRVGAHLVKKALTWLIQRHDSFRTGFQMIGSQLVQVIKKEIETPLKALDLSSVEQPGKESKRQEIYSKEFSAPFDLNQMPLFRTALLKLAEEKYELLFNMHHLISDGWSIEVLIDEFNTIYNAYKTRIPCDMPPLEIQYKDYTAWQNRLLADEEKIARAKEFWSDQLLASLPVLNLPYDFSRPADSKESAAYRWVINEEVTIRLRRMAIDYCASLFMVLLAGFNIFLSKITGQEEIIIAIPAAARQHEELKNIVGLFVNTLIIRTKVNAGEDFTDFFKRLQDNTFKILEYQGIPLELICGQLKIKYPTIPVFFNMINIRAGNLEKLTNFENFHMEKVQDAKFDMVCYVNEYQNGIEIQCHYFKDRFKPSSIEKLMNLYEKILDNISIEPAKKVEEYILTGKERTLKRKSQAGAGTVTLIKKK